MDKAVEISSNSIHLVIMELIRQKSLRDNINFNGSQLAAAINVERSIISRLIHPDPQKRITNPKIDTLIKIVDFFRSDGFDIKVDDLLSTKSRIIDVQEQNEIVFTRETIPLFSFDSSMENKLGETDVKVANSSTHLIAFYATETINMFKQGTVFIVDTSLLPKDDTLVAVKIANYKTILIRKYHEKANKKILISFEESGENIILSEKVAYKIIGVVVQIDAKTK